MSTIDIFCEHDEGESCPACEGALRKKAAEEQRENRAQAEWERTVRQFETVSAHLAEAAETERLEREAAASEVRAEVTRSLRWNLLWRLIATALTLHLLLTDAVTAPGLAAGLVGGTALLLYRASSARSGPRLPDLPGQRRQLTGAARAVLWSLLQIPAIGAATTVVILLMAMTGMAGHGSAERMDLVLTAVWYGALIGGLGLRRVAVEQPFGRRATDHQQVEARHQTMRQSRNRSFPVGREPESVGLAALRDEVAQRAGLTPAGHEALEAVRVGVLEKRRATAAERAALLERTRERVAEERRERGRIPLDRFAAQLSGHTAWGSVGRWKEAPWYEALPGSADDLDGAVREFVQDFSVRGLFTGTGTGLPDGPHPTAEITDSSGKVITVVAVCGRNLRVCAACPRCGQLMLGDGDLTDPASLLEAAGRPFGHTCPLHTVGRATPTGHPETERSP